MTPDSTKTAASDEAQRITATGAVNPSRPDVGAPAKSSMGAAKERMELTEVLREKRNSYRLWGSLWSVAYHLSLYLSIFLNVAAALVLKLDYFSAVPYQSTPWQTDVATSLVVVSAILIALNAAANYSRRWRMNRLSRDKTEQLLLKLSSPNMNADEIRQAMNEIMKEHSEGILGPQK